MEINHHICFNPSKVPELVCYLREYNVPFEDGDDLSVLDIYESNDHWPHINSIVQSEKLFCASETIYSKEEKSQAEWLSIRSQWRFGYPQPENDFGYENITYSRRNYCSFCSCGLKQVGPFRIKKTPKWGKRHFAELNWIGDELFVDNGVMEIFTQAGITGVSFLEVRNQTGAEVINGIHQLGIDRIVEHGLQTDYASIRAVSYCTQCKTPKFLPSGIGTLRFNREIFENQPDVVKTEEMFGSDHYAARIILVRQKVYQQIIKNKLERGLVFEPVELI